MRAAAKAAAMNGMMVASVMINSCWKTASREELLDLLEWTSSVREAEKEIMERYRTALSDIAEHECGYGDNCPPFIKLNHGRCLQCVARKALGNEP